MCFSSEIIYSKMDKQVCRVLLIMNVIGNGLLIIWWIYIWYRLHLAAGGLNISLYLYTSFPIPVTLWLTLVILSTVVTYIISVVLLYFKIYNRGPGPMKVYYVVSVVATVLVIVISVVQLGFRDGVDSLRFFAEPTVNGSIWGLFVCGVNLLLLVLVYNKMDEDSTLEDATPPNMLEDAKLSAIPLQEVTSMLPSAPPLYLLEDDV